MRNPDRPQRWWSPVLAAVADQSRVSFIDSEVSGRTLSFDRSAAVFSSPPEGRGGARGSSRLDGAGPLDVDWSKNSIPFSTA